MFKMDKNKMSITTFTLTIFLIIAIIIFTTAITQINKTITRSKKEEIEEFSYKIYSITLDGAETVITFENEKKISQIIYTNNKNEEINIYPKNKNKVAIDFKMQDFHTYNFKVAFEDLTTKEYTVDFEIPTICIGIMHSEGHNLDDPSGGYYYSWEEIKK